MSITIPAPALLGAVLARADDALVLGHRLSEWCGHAPLLEEDIALANLALDLIGQARALYTLAAAREGNGRTEDHYAYRRDERAFRNLLLVEQPNGDFAHTIIRHLLYAGFAWPFWRNTSASADSDLAAIAAKVEKELAYHWRHAEEWTLRLGDGTVESHARTQAALDALWPFTEEMFSPEAPELVAATLLPDPAALRPEWERRVRATLATATLAVPAAGFPRAGGREGRHSEAFGHMLAEFQHLHRSHPGAVW